MTHDKKFVVKELKKIEKHELVDFCGKYLSYLQENKRSLMAKIFGLFSLKI